MVQNNTATEPEDECCECCSCGGAEESEDSKKAQTAKKSINPLIVRLCTGALIFAAALVTVYFTKANEYISLAVFIASYLILGYDILFKAGKKIIKGRVFSEQLLMSIATIGAFAIGEYPEAVAVMLFYQVGEYFQSLAVSKSKKSIAALMDIRPDYANLKTGTDITRVDPCSVNTGDIIVVRPGEKIPLDGIVIEGISMLDTAALTGEVKPRSVGVSAAVFSGCVNQNGVLTIEVTKPFGESTASKIIDLVENAGSKKAPTENFISKFARYYTPAVVALAALIAVLPPLILSGGWSDWINRGLIFLVISCPCALVISIPLSFFGGIGSASKRGILVKGGNYLEALGSIDIAVFDKTGTLTKGVFKVTGIHPQDGFTEAALLELAAKAEAFSGHPIARSIDEAYNGKIDKTALSEYNETAGYGVSVKSGGKTIYAGSYKYLAQAGISISISEQDMQSTGTSVHVAVGNIYAGCIIISDEIKPGSVEAIASLKEKGVRKTVMLTGDEAQTAEAVAGRLNLDETYAGLLPGEKVDMVEKLMEQLSPKGKLAFVGDGINDAPVLARADIGIAMGSLGSDAAIEAADVVLMTDELSALIDAVDISRFTKRVVWQNIAFALGIKCVFLLLGALGAASMWEAVFADVGVSLLAVLNATRIGMSRAAPKR